MPVQVSVKSVLGCTGQLYDKKAAVAAEDKHPEPSRQSCRSPLPGRLCRQQCSGSCLRVGRAVGSNSASSVSRAHSPSEALGELLSPVVNTICRIACLDVAFLPGRRESIITYAERTHLVPPREGKKMPRRAKGSRDLLLGEQLVGLAIFLGWMLTLNSSEYSSWARAGFQTPSSAQLHGQLVL